MTGSELKAAVLNVRSVTRRSKLWWEDVVCGVRSGWAPWILQIPTDIHKMIIVFIFTVSFFCHHKASWRLSSLRPNLWLWAAERPYNASMGRVRCLKGQGGEKNSKERIRVKIWFVFYSFYFISPSGGGYLSVECNSWRSHPAGQSLSKNWTLLKKTSILYL